MVNFQRVVLWINTSGGAEFTTATFIVALLKEAEHSSEILVNIYQTTRCHNLKYQKLQLEQNITTPQIMQRWKKMPYPMSFGSRSQWSSGLGHELFSPAPTLRSWVRIPHRHGFLCVFCVRFFCFYSLKWDRLVRTYHWISLQCHIQSHIQN
jgi:hypothetical protein